MNKFLILGLVFIVILFLFTRIYITDTNKNKPLKASVSIPAPQPSTNPKPLIKTTKTSEDKNLIEIDEYQLKVTIPTDWEASLFDSPVFINKDGIQKQYEGALVIQSPSQDAKIGIVPNFQGGWCEGPSEPKKEILPKRFGLPATKFDCGSVFYLYGDLNKPGSVFPNLFLSVSSDSSGEIQEVISSISYIPTE